ncbi:DEAD/DEAH box helicase [Hansschlegelia quercus]|uniref:DEAD/DEAH box helicase n=1 Tax=Hansschlegelia quercus TaxID=2528245 RepID=A0A4Q9GBU3_9HYPH|nr:DEAD/DEAH box helicase [Hansschlegelia quercus]TBN48761.1 DEAD/DEAH box helicase [Hansschlegelia quercus]
MRALSLRGYDTLTAVQDAVISAESGRDLLVSAQTGSGKTVAYGLALGDTLLGSAERFGAPGQPLALVVAPTRELAMQVEREFAWLFGEAGGRIVACVGGMDPRAERRRLDAGAHIVVGTPGRLKDHIERNALDVSGLKAVVLDEADEMLDLGFREDLEFILETTPSERRTLLFSATVPAAIVAIARRFQRDALRVEAAGEEGAHADIEHRAIRVMPRGTDAAVVNVLRQQDAAAAIVFCSTREAVRRLHMTLAKRGFSAVVLSGELSQNERNRALEEIRDGRARVCVATDVAARGIDLANVELVIHADLPHDAEVFQHRSGRTGRAGRKGVSVLLAPASRRRKAELLMQDAGITPVWSAAPSADEIRMLDRERLANDPAMSSPAGEQELARARELIEAKGAEAVAVALLRLHAARLPEPHFVEDPGEWSAPRERRPDRNGAREADRGPREAAPPRRRDEFGAAVWFRLNVGRAQNADPKWLLPMICRRGGVNRDEVGAIRIFDKDSKVAIAVEAAERFADAALGAGKGEVLFTRSEAPAAQGAKEAYKPAREQKPAAPRPPRAEATEGWSPKPWRDKPRQARPDFKPAEPRFGQETPAGVKPWAAKHRPAKSRPPHNDGAKRSAPRSAEKAKRAPARREGRS